MKKSNALYANKSYFTSHECLSTRQVTYKLTPSLSKIFLLGLSLVVSSFAWASSAGLKILKQSGPASLVKTENGREAVYVERNGVNRFVGYVGKIRKGTPLYHWGDATPEQAAKWNAAGSISPDLLNHLIDTNQGAYGGGFYASTDRTDSMSYGNTQITIVIPHDVKIIDQAVNEGLILNQPGVNAHIAKLGISAFRNASRPTWHNFIDAKSLTKEHVTTLVEWTDTWRNNPEKLVLMNKFPEILRLQKVRKENKIYFNYLNLLNSQDLTGQLSALEYFYSIQDPLGLRLSLISISKRDPENPRFLEIARSVLRDRSSQMRLSAEAFFVSWTTPQSTRLILDYYKEAPSESQYVAAFLVGHEQKEAVDVLLEIMQKSDEFMTRMRAQQALSGRSDSESLKFIERQMDRNPDYGISLLEGRQDEASLRLIEKLMDDYKEDAIRCLQGRKDERSLEVIARLLKGPDLDTKAFALRALSGRIDSRVAGMIEPFLKSSEYALVYAATESLRGQQDAKSLAIIKRLIKAPEAKVPELVSLLHGRSDAESLPVIKKVILGDNYFAIMAATDVLMSRTDSKGIEMIEELMAKGKIHPEKVDEVLRAYHASGQFTPKQIETELKTSQMNDIQKYKHVRDAMEKSVERRVLAPVCKSIFSN